jgi:hypothetical protein
MATPKLAVFGARDREVCSFESRLEVEVQDA